MSRASALARGRAAAEAGMTDTCTVRRQQPGGITYDDETGVTTPTSAEIYAGPCRLKQPSPGATAATVGEAQVLLVRPELHVPVSAALLLPGDEVTLTGSTFDPASAGRVFKVGAVPAHTQATARRYEVIERTS